MRVRLLAGAGALADYEIVEMLLFLGIPRRDTKPQAKGLINQFGSFAGALTADAAGLALAGIPTRVKEVFSVVVDAAAQLAKAERTERVLLGDWDALDLYLRRPGRHSGGLSVLLLNNRNHLLADVHLPAGEPSAIARAVLKHALERHATALILVRDGEAADVTAADRALLAHVRASAVALSVPVHDLVVTGAGNWAGVDRGAD